MIQRFLTWCVFPVFFLAVIFSSLFIGEHINLISDLGNRQYLLIMGGFLLIYLLNLGWFKHHAKTLALIIANLLLLELLLQIAAMLGIIPGMRITWRTPYGRAYHSAEGFNNGMMNRYGWHYTAFPESPAERPIVLIGDSFIDAHEVNRHQNIGVRLESLLAEQGSKQQVMALGLTGAGPAQYLEMLKYSYRHFRTGTAIVLFFLGNDFSNALHEADSHMRKSPAEYIYYTLNDSGNIRLMPGSDIARGNLINTMERNHTLSPGQLLKTAFGYVLTPQIIANVFQTIRFMIKKSKPPATADDEIVAAFNNIGLTFDAFIYRQPLDETGKKALAVVEQLMLQMQDYADSKGIDLVFATIPHFPQIFFQTMNQPDWHLTYQDYDFLLPEKRLADFSAANGITFWQTGKWMQASRIPPAEIQQLFFLNGSGHFTPAGHAFFARFLAQQLKKQLEHPGNTVTKTP